MARIEHVRLVDDLSGDPGDETVQFGLDSRAYDIDLSSANAAKLRAALSDYVTAARPAGNTTRTAPASRRSPTDRAANQAVRAWARENGITIAERGRIPAVVSLAHAEGRPELAKG